MTNAAEPEASRLGRTAPQDAGSSSRPSGPPAAGLFRVLATSQALLALFQAIFIGAFFSGRYDALQWHSVNASAVGVVVFLVFIVALFRRGTHRESTIQLGLSSATVIATVAQIAAGYARVVALHVPLGILIVAASAVLVTSAWRQPGGENIGPARTDQADGDDESTS